MTEKISGRFDVVFLLLLKTLKDASYFYAFYGWYSIVSFRFADGL
jgi:hypothetical protein